MMRFVDLFAGTGGIRLGFEQACVSSGIRTECVYSCEIDRKACESYRLNFGQDAYADIREANNLPDFDFLLAGFPCQSFSYAGKQRGFGDTRGTLFFEVERLLKRHQPTHFLLENVRGLTTHDKGRTFRTIEERLHALGYHTQVKLLNSCHFGVPQNRVRIYIVGSRKEPVRSSLRSDTGPADSHSYRRAGQASLLNSGPRTLVRDILQSRVEEKYLCSPDFVNRLQRIVGKDLSSLHGYRLIDYRGGNAIHS
ncbi:MAG: DNA cytosine methyltransferase, partial [Desulfovibrio sp.]